MSGAAERIVVVHGPASPATLSALRSVGLTIIFQLGDTTVWAPLRVPVPVTVARRSPRPSRMAGAATRPSSMTSVGVNRGLSP